VHFNTIIIHLRAVWYSHIKVFNWPLDSIFCRPTRGPVTTFETRVHHQINRAIFQKTKFIGSTAART